ncbi:MAG TPA: transporter [Tepidisphaeraceae bacterium]|jgi:hypothetical protein|nr:transporter [Tepidisphaeraceae bacterium]
MIHRLFLAICLAALYSAAAGRAVQGVEPVSASQSVPQPPDKWRYTLFDPTPADQLRGMDTDRPNATNTPHTIDAGHLQLEAGALDYSYYRDRSINDDVRSDDFSFGQFNFRLGLLNNLEVNAVIDAYDLDRSRRYDTRTSARAAGFGDTVVGGKLNFWGDDGGEQVWTTAFAVQAQFKVPTARSNVGNGRFEFSVAFPFLMNLPAGFHLDYQPGVSYQRDSLNGGYVTGMENAVSIDRVVWRNLDVYLEYASDVTTESHVKAVQTLDVGGSYSLSDNVVIDLGVNFGLNNASTTVEMLTGVSVRF